MMHIYLPSLPMESRDASIARPTFIIIYGNYI